MAQDPKVDAITIQSNLGPVEDAVSISVGSEIGGRYVVLKRLGAGGAGNVYLCNDLRATTGVKVAVKVLERTETIDRFRREHGTLFQIDHPNVIKCLDYGTWGQRHFMVLELADGGSIHDLITSTHAIPVPLASWIIFQTVQGLRAGKTVHRDLKPENLLVIKGRVQAERERDPKQLKAPAEFIVGDPINGARVVVADWGLARDDIMGDQRLTKTQDVMGTPYYMSPEQCRSTKDTDVRSDIYQIGVIFYELVTGDLPFLGDDTYSIMAAHIEDQVVYPPTMDPAVQMLIATCMQKDRQHRYQTLRDLQHAIVPFLGLPPDWRYLHDTTITTEAKQEQPAPASGSWLGRIRKVFGG